MYVKKSMYSVIGKGNYCPIWQQNCTLIQSHSIIKCMIDAYYAKEIIFWTKSNKQNRKTNYWLSY